MSKDTTVALRVYLTNGHTHFYDRAVWSWSVQNSGLLTIERKATHGEFEGITNEHEEIDVKRFYPPGTYWHATVGKRPGFITETWIMED